MRVFRWFAALALAALAAHSANACPTQTVVQSAVVQTAPAVAVQTFATPFVPVLAPATIATPAFTSAALVTPAVAVQPLVVEQQVVREHRPRVQVTRIRVRSR